MNGNLPRCIEIIEPEMVSVLKTKTASERLAMGFNLRISARKLATNLIKSQYPALTEEEIEKIVSKRFLDGSI